MDNFEQKSIQKLLSKYNFEVDPKYKNVGLTCTVCGRLMIDAYQTHCGCKYCHKCIIKHLDGMDEYCRGGKSECREEPLVLERNVTSSPALNRQISKSRVVCPYESCGAIVELCGMEGHMELCAHRPMECPYSEIGCACGMTSNQNMETHLHTAIFAHSQLVVESIKEQRAKFDVSLEDAVNARIKCDENQRNELIVIHKEMNEMRSQMERNKSESSSREARMSKTMRALKAEIKAERQRLEALETRRSEEMRALKAEVDGGRQRLETLKVTMNGTMSTLKVDVEAERQRLVIFKTRCSEEMRALKAGVEAERKRSVALEGRAEKAATTVSINAPVSIADSLITGRGGDIAFGELWFTVYKMAARMEEKGGFVESPHLYSHFNGYKLRIRVNTRGRDGGAELRVSSVVCMGEYDDVLPWPCRFTLSVSMVNRDTKQPHETRIIEYGSDTGNRYCERPIDRDNPPYPTSGWLLLIAHSAIRSSGAIVDDSLLFHVVVAR